MYTLLLFYNRILNELNKWHKNDNTLPPAANGMIQYMYMYMYMYTCTCTCIDIILCLVIVQLQLLIQSEPMMIRISYSIKTMKRQC